MANEYLDKVGLTYFWGKLKAYFQVKLVSGTNIKTINNQSVLGSGNITIEGGASIPYLTCADEASTVAKTTTLVSGTLPPTLAVGQQIVVKFSYYNSALSPTLEVGTYGAIPMTRYGATTIGTDIKTSWHSGAVCSFTYDGTNWVLHSDFDENTTYSIAGSNTSGIVPAASSAHSVLRRTSTTSISWGKVTNLMLNTASATPMANYVAEFDSTAHMNSTDMTETEVDEFVDGLEYSIQTNKPCVVAVSFEQTLTSKTTGGKTASAVIDVPDGYEVVPNCRPLSPFISGAPTVIITDRGYVTMNGTTASFSYYLYNPNNVTSNLVILASILCRKVVE